uniref:Uncharacterized protein n=1 Tax=Melopsittacus undulatus TaxID=13146 RepID=A0A8V5FS46_MELUD
MKALVALILLVQLLIHKAVPAAPPAPLGCDDPESEAAAAVAVNYINGHSQHGYKFALNRIENIRVLPQQRLCNQTDIARNTQPGSALLNLVIVTLFINSYLSEQCNPLIFYSVQAVEGDCDVKLQRVDGILSVLASKCHSHADSSEDVLQLCPDCPLLASLNNTEVLTAVTTSLNEHNSKTADAYLRLLEIGRAKIQVIHHPTHAVSVEFAVAATNCSAEVAKVNVEACQLLPEDQSVSRSGKAVCCDCSHLCRNSSL